jgi:site-specific DNA-cytosine methylase
MTTHGELFAGIGGFGLGFDNAGMKTIWHVEIDKNCQDVLRMHNPDSLILSSPPPRRRGLKPMIGVRRLTPTECERLQGFPDGWTKRFHQVPPTWECRSRSSCAMDR